jgi:hypothetical protein
MGLYEKSNTVYIIDLGLSRRYKDKNTGQHIPYRQNRHLMGTARYASINAHLGIEQSRLDDIESIGLYWYIFSSEDCHGKRRTTSTNHSREFCKRN